MRIDNQADNLNYPYRWGMRDSGQQQKRDKKHKETQDLFQPNTGTQFKVNFVKNPKTKD